MKRAGQRHWNQAANVPDCLRLQAVRPPVLAAPIALLFDAGSAASRFRPPDCRQGLAENFKWHGRISMTIGAASAQLIFIRVRFTSGGVGAVDCRSVMIWNGVKVVMCITQWTAWNSHEAHDAQEKTPPPLGVHPMPWAGKSLPSRRGAAAGINPWNSPELFGQNNQMPRNKSDMGTCKAFEIFQTASTDSALWPLSTWLI